MTLKVLITGGSGQVGWELARCLHVNALISTPSRAELDLSRPTSIRNVVDSLSPDLIIHPAAYTAVDRAEEESELAFTVNATAVEYLAQAAKARGCPIVYLSTDYVFDGESDAPYGTHASPNPLSVYGASKLAGERALRASGLPHWTVRTSWVYASRGRNFLLTMKRLLTTREEVRVVDDQRGAPTWARTIAEALAQALHPVLITREHPMTWFEQTSGVYHLTANGSTTWYGFAQAIARQLNERSSSRALARLLPIAGAEYPTAAHRPSNSRLDCTSFRDTFAIALPQWQDALALCLDELNDD